MTDPTPTLPMKDLADRLSLWVVPDGSELAEVLRNASPTGAVRLGPLRVPSTVRSRARTASARKGGVEPDAATVGNLAQVAAHHFKAPVDHVVGVARRQTPPAINARRAVFRVLLNAGWSAPRIARAAGMDHTTVYAIQRRTTEAVLVADPVLAEAVAVVREALSATQPVAGRR